MVALWVVSRVVHSVGQKVVKMDTVKADLLVGQKVVRRAVMKVEPRVC